jgi:hypothetical protein
MAGGADSGSKVMLPRNPRGKRGRHTAGSTTGLSKPYSPYMKGEDLIIYRSWSGPGALRSNGPRHGNGTSEETGLWMMVDHADFRKIRICPTADELLCAVEPYLPTTIKGLRHHLSSTSVERMYASSESEKLTFRLDTHFRLLREDAFSDFREGVAGIVGDLERGEARRESSSCSKPLIAVMDLIREGGGGYNPTTFFTSSGCVRATDALRHLLTGLSELPLITNVKFSGVGLDKNYGLVIQVTADAPPGALRDALPKARADFLIESARLGYGALVALITPSDEVKTIVSLAVIASSTLLCCCKNDS